MDTNIITTIQTIVDKKKYIDIHCHIINNVDDGSNSLEQSLRELIIAKKMGMKNIICTSHICYGKDNKLSKIENNYNILKEYSKILGVNLYLGNEILYNNDIIELLKSKKIKSLNDSKYILIEFKRNENMNFEQLLNCLEELLDHGYKVILAHPELYLNYNKIEYMKKLKEEGILLQLDASSILRKNKRIYKFSKKLLKNNLIDFVASDNHCNSKRNYYVFKKAYKKIKRKYKKDYVNKIFYENPNLILKRSN